MTTLDYHLLGEKKHYYCSESESEDAIFMPDITQKSKVYVKYKRKPSVNTGPKAVLEDWKKSLQKKKKCKENKEIIDIQTHEMFLHLTDGEESNEMDITCCDTVNGCFIWLAKQFPNVKFCKFRASVAGLSLNFKKNGLPTILIYKRGTLIKTLIKISNELGDDFYANDLYLYFIQQGVEMINKSKAEK